MALTGQQISANLYFNNLSVDFNQPRTYQWSVSSTNAFENWNSTTVPQLLRLDPSDPDCTGKYASFTFVDAIDNDKVAVTCTATFTYTDGTPGTVTVTSPPVTFIKPTATWTIIGGSVQELPNMNPGYVNIGLLSNGAAPDSNGMNWLNATISVPAPFPAGAGCFGQTIKPNGTITTSTGTIPNPGYNDADGNTNNGAQCLDVQFPAYNDQPGLGPWNTASKGNAGDSPHLVFPSPSYGNAGVTEEDVDNVFNTWVMFNPNPNPTTPTSGDVWVPILTYNWEWTETVGYNIGTDQWYLESGSYSVNGNTVGGPLGSDPYPSFNSTPTNTYPSWTDKQGNTTP